ncbi:MerR family DNA-binding transcriptional regulator [Methylobacterium komagatae]|jgi:MerR family transcriptional regulator, copper efflux regulator|uniref:MerR family DNA-binding transcriptional regulator n=1 Tax=Methylobacterium komagatae TaxID=374425 RepID=A0ABW2BHQ3_9HYPH|nr:MULTISPECIES: MerR family DNA-binding transcriptional regulator [Methylobacterium]MDE3744203.1 MerR family DNA-binding transcriptional regulator [Methylobacterium radiotolerans]MWV22657.1 MerR family DNA-binding transcriptional regulator [Methylobacterium sp. 2A]PVZ07254.1 MerR family gold-responsive transcriptional activator of gol and ges genes [Methylobacterium organophilum]
MRIGEAARACGISPKMIRYYERTGLIPSPTRSVSGHRVYAEEEVRTLRFVHRARLLGFSVADTATLLRLWRDEARASAGVKDLALRRATDLERRAAALADAAASLRGLAGICPGDDRPECPLLDALAREPARAGGGPTSARPARIEAGPTE